MKFELSENPTTENTSAIEREAVMLTKQKEIAGTTPILKIKVNGLPYYHFNTGVFDEELATRNSTVKVGGKVFYLGKVDKRMKVRMNLNSKS
jgi:hypothetical protein